jgi:MoaA/NifB/PqqE/SkfB family radical SAM enzyme
MKILGVKIKPKARRVVSSSPALNFIAKGYKGIIHLKSYQVYFSRNKPVSLSKKNIQEYNRSRPVHNFKYVCHAPFTNMYFGFGGKIRACCYNVSHQLGKYPETSIMEAWKGEAAEELRDKIKEYDLTAGCYCCQVQLVEKAFYTVLARNYDDLKAPSAYPISMEFELSNKCNLECVMCSETYSSTISEKRGITMKDDVYGNEFIHQLKAFIPYLKKTKFLG